MQRTEIENTSLDIDVRTLNDLARQWVEFGWRHTPDAPFDFHDRLEHLNFGAEAPLAGTKQSGLGVEWTELGLAEFCQINVINQAA